KGQHEEEKRRQQQSSLTAIAPDRGQDDAEARTPAGAGEIAHQILEICGGIAARQIEPAQPRLDLTARAARIGIDPRSRCVEQDVLDETGAARLDLVTCLAFGVEPAAG